MSCVWQSVKLNIPLRTSFLPPPRCRNVLIDRLYSLSFMTQGQVSCRVLGPSQTFIDIWLPQKKKKTHDWILTSLSGQQSLKSARLDNNRRGRIKPTGPGLGLSFSHFGGIESFPEQWRHVSDTLVDVFLHIPHNAWTGGSRQNAPDLTGPKGRGLKMQDE